jgi:hypothetical protein
MGSTKFRQGGDHFRLGNQRHSGLDQNMSQYQAIKFRAGPHFQFEILFNFSQPGEISGGTDQLGCAAQLADRAVDRDRADPFF